jgi:hypothetical protein
MALLKSKNVRLILLIIATVLLTWFITRVVWLSVSDTGIPGPYSPQAVDGSVQFIGAWRAADDPGGYTGQAVIIDCREAANECAISSSFVSSSGWVYSDMGYYDITEFADGMIRAEQDGFCANSVLTADATDPDAPVVRLVSTWKQEKAEECYLDDEPSTEWVLGGVEPSWVNGISSSLKDGVWELTGKQY